MVLLPVAVVSRVADEPTPKYRVAIEISCRVDRMRHASRGVRRPY